ADEIDGQPVPGGERVAQEQRHVGAIELGRRQRLAERRGDLDGVGAPARVLYRRDLGQRLYPERVLLIPVEPAVLAPRQACLLRLGGGAILPVVDRAPGASGRVVAAHRQPGHASVVLLADRGALVELGAQVLVFRPRGAGGQERDRNQQ